MTTGFSRFAEAIVRDDPFFPTAITPQLGASQKKDPYSLQLTYVFPNWQDRFKSEKENDNNFREFIERVIREETPVHLTVYVRWWNREEMAAFETTYYQFFLG